ncbi:MAG TPA: S8 family serine peptidase, partial [Ferruginibacter sp.]|nr:S8 family serine peptidase [Ferruginibacter sp.]
MRKTLPLLIISLILAFNGKAQLTRYIVKLKDKATTPFSISNPSQFLGSRAIQRRTKYNISIDSTDLPVTPRYVDSIRLAGAVTILNTSKWLNQVAIKTSDPAAIAKINSFPFVISATPAGSFTPTLPENNKWLSPLLKYSDITAPAEPAGLLDYFSYGRSNGQVKIHKGEFLHNHGFRGEGMQMAILDAGFFHYLTLPTFDSVRLGNQILNTWDFVANEASVNEDYVHGMQCFSIIAANLPGTFVGTAPKASFYLYRTEDINSEYPIEEQNYAAGLERADSVGVDITSTSLGYFDFDPGVTDYTYADMNGNTSISARAADLAAKKGIMMVIAAGNEGNNAWHYLITPSDGDSVLSVGAVDTLGNSVGFSSYGPSSDGQVKPGVAAVGFNAVIANSSTGQPGYGNGTSFACPNMAGLTTCLMQAFPEVNNMAIIDALQKSASKAGLPDNRVGYGIPDMKKAFVLLIRKSYIQQLTANTCEALIQFSAKSDNTISLVIERKLTSETGHSILQTLQNNGSFALHNFTYTDNLSNIPTGAINYRIRMNIAADTSFYLDSAIVNFVNNCIVIDNEISIRPEIVTDAANIYITRATPAKIGVVIQNAAGQRVYSNSFQQAIGTQVLNIPMKRM